MSSTTFSILARGMFSSSNDTCRSYEEDTAADPIVGSLTFHKLMTYISLGAMGVCVVSTMIIVVGHIFTYREPRIQKNLVRVILTAPIFAVCCTIGVASYHATQYITPWAELYEAFGLIAVLLLMINLLTPLARTWEQELAFFADPAVMGAKQFTRTNISVFQLLPVRIVLTIAAIVISAVDCVGGKHYRRGHLIISVINGISTVVALIALFKFLKRFIRQLIVHDPKIVGKLACFKLIVAVQFIQRIVLNILTQANVLKPTATLSYDDLNLGLGSFLTTLEAALIGLAMVWYYWHGQFRHQKHVEAGNSAPVMPGGGQNAKMSPLKALWDVIDLWDVIRGSIKAVRLHLKNRRGEMQTPIEQTPYKPIQGSYGNGRQVQYPAPTVQK